MSTEEIDDLETRMIELRQAMKEDSQLDEYVHRAHPIADVDEKRDEVYYSEETYKDVSGMAHRLDGRGDTRHGVRLRVSNDADLDSVLARVTALVGEFGFTPEDVIQEPTERLGYVEIQISCLDRIRELHEN